jgi:hypothetical protein
MVIYKVGVATFFIGLFLFAIKHGQKQRKENE